MLREALELKERLGDERGAAIIRGSLGNALSAAGRLAEAEAQYEAAVAGLAQVGDRFGEALMRDNLGATRIASGDAAGAIPLLRRAVALAEELDARSVLASAGAHLGCALLESDRKEAAALLNRSVSSSATSTSLTASPMPSTASRRWPCRRSQTAPQICSRARTRCGRSAAARRARSSACSGSGSPGRWPGAP